MVEMNSHGISIANYVEIVEQPEEEVATEEAVAPSPPPPPPPVIFGACGSGRLDADISIKPPAPVAFSAPPAPPRPPTPEPPATDQGITAVALYEYVHKFRNIHICNSSHKLILAAMTQPKKTNSLFVRVIGFTRSRLHRKIGGKGETPKVMLGCSLVRLVILRCVCTRMLTARSRSKQTTLKCKSDRRNS
jgi:hypothetical protein